MHTEAKRLNVKIDLFDLFHRRVGVRRYRKGVEHGPHESTPEFGLGKEEKNPPIEVVKCLQRENPTTRFVVPRPHFLGIIPFSYDCPIMDRSLIRCRDSLAASIG